MKRLALLASASVLVLASCQQINSQVVDPLITDLAKINATALADLQTAQAVAQAATPPDTDGYNCYAAVITLGGQIKSVLAAANAPQAGVITTAEIATLFQPGSQQYNQAKQELTSGCAAKAQDVLGPTGLLAAGGVTTAIAAGKVLPILAAAP